MQKIKTIGISIAILTLISGAFVGTKALFTSTEVIDTSLTISTGSIDISSNEETLEWIPAQGIDKSEDGSYEDLKSGDTFRKTITITNNSTIDSEITFRVMPDVHLPIGIIMNAKYMENNLSNGSKLEIAKGDNIDIILELEIGEEANGNVSKQELANIYEIHAVQK